MLLVGDTLKLKAVLLGEPSPDVSWYVNGKKLQESNKIQILEEKGTYTVIIKDITMDYSGEVLCKAINEYGEASSSGNIKPAEYKYCEDWLITLSCIAPPVQPFSKWLLIFV